MNKLLKRLRANIKVITYDDLLGALERRRLSHYGDREDLPGLACFAAFKATAAPQSDVCAYRFVNRGGLGMVEVTWSTRRGWIVVLRDRAGREEEIRLDYDPPSPDDWAILEVSVGASKEGVTVGMGILGAGQLDFKLPEFDLSAKPMFDQRSIDPNQVGGIGYEGYAFPGLVLGPLAFYSRTLTLTERIENREAALMRVNALE